MWIGKRHVISYKRMKTGTIAIMRLDEDMEEILRDLPGNGPLFPYLRSVRAGDRATEFKQRCVGLGIKGVSLHSYRYAWAERAKTAGYPERFAQEALQRIRATTARPFIAPIRARPRWNCHRCFMRRETQHPRRLFHGRAGGHIHQIEKAFDVLIHGASLHANSAIDVLGDLPRIHLLIRSRLLASL
jgi:hypothetical protein